MESSLRQSGLTLVMLLAGTLGTAVGLHGQSTLQPVAAILARGTVAVLLVAGLLALLVVGVVLLLRVRRGDSRGTHSSRPPASSMPDPPLIFPILPSDPADFLPRSSAARPTSAPRRRRPPRPPRSGAAPHRRARPGRGSAATDGPEPAVAPPGDAETSRSEAPTVPAREPEPEVLPEQPAWPPQVVPEPVPANGGELFEGHTIRYYRPVEETVQFLPGRLEVVGGDDRGQDIRFVRTWGSVPEITFGRSSGPPHRHVQLRARTASREHARLRFLEGEWKITNLSRTNPLVINGEELGGSEEMRTLRDGDLIEMGEVVFRFRER